MTQRVVEYCDSIRAKPLRNYFKEKISIIAAQTVKKPPVPERDMLFQMPTNHLRGGITFKNIRKESNDEPIKEKELEHYREKKSRQWNFEENLSRQVQEGAKSIDKVLDQTKVVKHNDQMVKDNLKAQQEALQEKLKQRRDRSFNKSINRGDDSSLPEGKPKTGESFFKAKVEDLNEDLMTREMLSQNILRLLDEIGSGGQK